MQHFARGVNIFLHSGLLASAMQCLMLDEAVCEIRNAIEQWPSGVDPGKATGITSTTPIKIPRPEYIFAASKF